MKKMRTLAGTLLLILVANAAAASAPASPSTGEAALERATARISARLCESKTLWEDHSSADDPWVVRTEHYEVRTTKPYYVARHLADGLETMAWHFQNVLGRAPRGGRALVRIFNTIEEYNGFGGNAGTHSSIYGGYYADQAPESPIAIVYSDEALRRGIWATHAATHHYLATTFPGEHPTWLVEGLACYFETYWDAGWAERGLRQLIDSGNYVRMRQVMSIGSIDDYANNSGTYFAQLRAFFRFLLHHHPDTHLPVAGDPHALTSFATYVIELLEGGDGEEHPFAQEILGDEEALGELFLNPWPEARV